MVQLFIGLKSTVATALSLLMCSEVLLLCKVAFLLRRASGALVLRFFEFPFTICKLLTRAAPCRQRSSVLEAEQGSLKNYRR